MTQTNLPILYLRDVVLLPFNDIRLEFSNDIEQSENQKPIDLGATLMKSKNMLNNFTPE